MNSNLVSYVKYSPNNYGVRTHKIDRITPHCVVGQCSIEALGNLFAKKATQASSNYGIGVDGRVGLFVDETNAAWCTSSRANDERAVTIECASDNKAPYAFKPVVYEKLIELCTDICRRNGKKKLLWCPNKATTLAYVPKEDEMVLTVHRWFANKSCVPIYSEVLTKHGWEKLSDIEIGDEIACADLDNLKITFEEVYDKVPVRSQDTYTTNDFTATKDHRMIYKYHNEEWRIDSYKNLLNAARNAYIPLAGYYNGEGLKITDDMLRFFIAVQADGHYMYETAKDGDKHYYGLEFHLKKERKIERIKEILESINLSWSENCKSDGSVSIRIYNYEDVDIVNDICESYLKDKAFTWDWLEMSYEQSQVFLDEILLWDGCATANAGLYTSSKKENLDIVNAIAAINGVGSRVSGANVSFRNDPYITIGANNIIKRNNRTRNTKETEVSCVSVKTGLFLVRQNGKTFITGNCPGDWLYSRMSDLAARVTANLGSEPAVVVRDDRFSPYYVQIVKKTVVRAAASGDSVARMILGSGVFTIVEEKNGFGKLKSGAGWVDLGTVRRV